MNLKFNNAVDNKILYSIASSEACKGHHVIQVLNMGIDSQFLNLLLIMLFTICYH
jgi:hypothetical protein